MWDKLPDFLGGHREFLTLLAGQLLDARLLGIVVVETRSAADDLASFGQFQALCV